MSLIKYAGWEDAVVSLIPHEEYCKLSLFKGVIFFGAGKTLCAFVPEQNKEFPENWEGHWWSKDSAFFAKKTVEKALAEFFKNHYNSKIIGLTDCRNLKAIKMAKLLGFEPRGFKWIGIYPYLLSERRK